ncbi:MAG: selenoneine biosynthesis selenosugar synthase SenB [Rhodoferax sp.]|uniref:selenoneine biosynthesis selenosugar synthase SenB n=1 Tax=Rhodoferax sp. TaxID=50421 RepID=UPI00271572FE|nr:selenoneine biosynthesis selenosugar synthase SenB [Rhodoferax sp.]MDO8449263.1 selenoneine biosynthesis selenosugar synthase SenB [Rhodoferax sp.]
MKKPHVLIISPALAGSNNGNWQTAWRWSRMLHPLFRTTIASQWQGEDADVMLALHARKSADAALAWAQAKGAERLAVVLTGTDLYRDIHTDVSAQRALQAAGQLVVLQERAPDALPEALRPKTRVIFQSAPRRATLSKTAGHVRALMVGHLRDEKDPLTYLRAAARLAQRTDIYLDHIGDALEPALGQAAQQAASSHPHYRWLGGLAHAQTRSRIQRAHVLVHPSKMEGGAHVILEAVQSGTPVLASRIDGNVGMLGPHYAGYFALGDDAALAALLQRCRDDAGFLPLLRQQCEARAPLFEPQREQALLRQLVARMAAA